MTKHTHRKGIVLAGGLGSRLYPVTFSVSKQLLPVYDKPMIYYPLSVLMLADIQDIMLISTPQDISRFELLLGDGSQWGIKIQYQVQEKPRGIPEAFLLAESFIQGCSSALILGDNIFYGHDFYNLLLPAMKKEIGATIFAYHVKDPERYGVIEFNSQNEAISLEEKPISPKSNFAVTGLYFYDDKAIEYVKTLKPSKRGELEITDLNQCYLDQKQLHVETMSRGYAWLDTGTHESLLEAGQFIATLENRQGLKIGCLEEIAYRKDWITKSNLITLIDQYKNNTYGQYLQHILDH